MASAQLPSNKRNGVQCNISFHLLVEIYHKFSVSHRLAIDRQGQYCYTHNSKIEATNGTSTFCRATENCGLVQRRGRSKGKSTREPAREAPTVAPVSRHESFKLV